MFEPVNEDFFDMLQILDETTLQKGITKNMVYISKNSDRLKDWNDHKGKPILAGVRPLNETEMEMNRFLLADNADSILNSLRSFVHI